MAYAISLGVILAGLWLLLSGHYVPLTLTAGFLSVVLAVWVARRMGIVDREGLPLHLVGRAIVYWRWLLGEIVKANLDVTRHILRPRLAITPTVIRVRATQRSDLGRTIFANSITLTPGTVSLQVHDDAIEVHALSRDAAQGLAGGDMDRRVTGMEGD